MGKHATIGGPPFRFSRIFPRTSARQLDDGVLADLARAMSVGGGSAASEVPAGFTYLGQFVAHDLSFSETRPPLGEFIRRRLLVLGRSPALDLDSLYGDGPDDPDAAGAYAPDRLHLRVGLTEPAEGFGVLAGHDLPRRDDSIAAVIPDARNDENLAVAQTHLAFVHFHNRVVDLVDDADSLAAARDVVTRHYQWAIRFDYLPRICSQAVIDDVFENGRKVFDADEPRAVDLTMPVEFAVAVFRFGHSMLRRGYSWNRCFDDGMLSLDLLFALSGGAGDLRGAPRLPSSAVADFRRLYELGGVTEGEFNRAMRIDTALAGPLGDVPATALDDREVPEVAAPANLAFRDLRRAKDLSLATGQELAAHLRSRGVVVDDLRPEQILDGADGARLDALHPAARAAIAADTPLWFYVLREAEVGDGRLAGVGAQIVVEVIHRAMEGSAASIVNDPAWRPFLAGAGRPFGMAELLRFAFDGQAAGLAPLEVA